MRITNPDGSTRNFTYDAEHRLVNQTDAGGHTTSYRYDAAGSVIQVDHPDGHSRGFSSTGAAGSAHLRPGDVGTESSPSPPASSTYTDPESHTHSFVVNAFGTGTAITGPMGRTTLMHRDRNDLLTLKQATGSAEGVTYHYDANGNLNRMSGPLGIEDSRDARGNLETAVMMDGRSYTFTCDERGLRQTMEIGGRVTQYGYDERGNLAQVILSTGGTWTLGRDDYGNVNSVTDPDDNTSTAVYDEMNLLESFVNGAGDEVQVTYSPASGNRAAGGMEPAAVITSIRDGRDNATLFEYDEMYRLRRISDELERSHPYTYDGVGRVQRHTLPSGHWVEYSYIYDANGNRETRTARIGGGVTRYEYDSENRLTQVTLPSTDRVQFAYDAMGRLALKVDSSGAIRRYVYDRDEVFAEFDGGGSLVRRYATRDGIDMLIGLISAGADYIVGTDSLGTVIGFLNDSVPAGSYQYQAFGKIVNEDAGAPQNERTFAGREYESESDIYAMRARFYDPNTGQFLQRDPLPHKAATAPYVYAANSPTNYRDPYGLDDDFNTQVVGFSTFFNKRVIEPLGQELIGRAASWYATGVVDVLTENTGLISGIGSGVGSRVGTGVGIAFQFKDLIKIMIADDPAQASIDWYMDEPWNPITDEMMDAFLTMGGTMPRREARIAPSCRSNAPRDRLIQLNLQSSRTLSQRR